MMRSFPSAMATSGLEAPPRLMVREINRVRDSMSSAGRRCRGHPGADGGEGPGGEEGGDG
jgi:hypothetical protein